MYFQTSKNQARNTEVPTTKRDVKAQRRWARGDARGGAASAAGGAGRALQASGEGAAQSAPARPLSAGKQGKRRPGPRRAAGERRPRRAWERRADARRCLRKTSEETTSALGTHRLCRWPLLPCNARATTQHELTATPRAQNVPRLPERQAPTRGLPRPPGGFRAEGRGVFGQENHTEQQVPVCSLVLSCCTFAHVTKTNKLPPLLVPIGNSHWETSGSRLNRWAQMESVTFIPRQSPPSVRRPPPLVGTTDSAVTDAPGLTRSAAPRSVPRPFSLLAAVALLRSLITDTVH